MLFCLAVCFVKRVILAGNASIGAEKNQSILTEFFIATEGAENHRKPLCENLSHLWQFITVIYRI